MDDATLREHQDATLAELGAALARLRDELTWTTQQLQEAQSGRMAAETEAAALRDQLAAVHESTTWRVGRALVGPLARLRRLRSGS